MTKHTSDVNLLYMSPSGKKNNESINESKLLSSTFILDACNLENILLNCGKISKAFYIVSVQNLYA